MATNKNQHFVPRCYLRPFTLDGADKALNVYNIDRDKFIVGAPVKSQCSGDYFYGENDALERVIQSVERPYADTVRKIAQPGYRLTEEHRDFMGLFWRLQHLRTDAAAQRSSEMNDQMVAVAGARGDEFRLKIREAVQVAMHVFGDTFGAVSDLKGVLLRNRSNTPFVTSDDPAVLANRWHQTYAGRGARSFGTNQAGTLLLLPLSPSILYLGYDGDVYSLPHEKGWVDVRDDADVDALNMHQFLNCLANLFVRDPATFETVRRDFKQASVGRLEARHRTTYAVFDGEYDGHSRFVAVPHAQAIQHERAIVHSEVLHAVPARWPKQIKWRTGAFVYSNGTGAGYVRRAFSLDRGGPPFEKINAFRV